MGKQGVHCSRFVIVIPRFVSLYEKIIHELLRVDYLAYRRTNMVKLFTLYLLRARCLQEMSAYMGKQGVQNLNKTKI